ncbi:MAG: hypothetical protein QNJ54_08290 [Prochloraceae cyanobacterium]|nr:hypothetical protein [Prochloraceae cyanobacterium]
MQKFTGWSLVLGAKPKTFTEMEIGQNLLNCHAEVRCYGKNITHDRSFSIILQLCDDKLFELIEAYLSKRYP